MSRQDDARSFYDRLTDSNWFLAVAYFVVAAGLFLLVRLLVV